MAKYLKYNDYDVYFKIIDIYNLSTATFRGVAIKSNHNTFIVGHEYIVYLDYIHSTEISEQDYNKIMVFE